LKFAKYLHHIWQRYQFDLSGPTEIVLTAKLILEKCHEQKTDLSSIFIDFT